MYTTQHIKAQGGTLEELEQAIANIRKMSKGAKVEISFNFNAPDQKDNDIELFAEWDQAENAAGSYFIYPDGTEIA